CLHHNTSAAAIAPALRQNYRPEPLHRGGTCCMFYVVHPSWARSFPATPVACSLGGQSEVQPVPMAVFARPDSCGERAEEARMSTLTTSGAWSESTAAAQRWMYGMDDPPPLGGVALDEGVAGDTSYRGTD